jgi:methylglutaconyl-CoA hydratase
MSAQPQTEGIILTEIEDGIGQISMNKTAKRNAFDEDMIAGLTEAFTKMGDDPEVRVVVLRGEGVSFCAGGDINWMRRTAEYSYEENVADARNLGALLKLINELPKPTIALVHGHVFGGGVGLTAACDIAISAAETEFCLSEVRIGLIPSIIAPYVIGAIGERQARRYFLTAERFNGGEARRIGLVHEVVFGHELDKKAIEIIKSIRDGAPGGQAMGKALIRDIARKPVSDEMIEHTVQRIAEARASNEGKEGLQAFLNKEEPSWRQ